MDYVQENYKKSIREIGVLKTAIKKVGKTHSLKQILVMAGDIATTVSKNETDQKVWKEARKNIVSL